MGLIQCIQTSRVNFGDARPVSSINHPLPRTLHLSSETSSTFLLSTLRLLQTSSLLHFLLIHTSIIVCGLCFHLVLHHRFQPVILSVCTIASLRVGSGSIPSIRRGHYHTHDMAPFTRSHVPEREPVGDMIRSHVFAERQRVPDQLKKDHPWLKNIEGYVDRWLPFGLPDHIDANEVYALLARSSKTSNFKHAAYGRVKSGLIDLLEWMSTRETWSSEMPCIPSPSSIMAICFIECHKEGLPSSINGLVEQAKLGHLLYPLGEKEVDPFWHGAMLEDRDWRAEHMLFGKPVPTPRNMPHQDLNVFFKGIMARTYAKYPAGMDLDTTNKTHSNKRPRDDETDNSRDDFDLSNPGMNVEPIAEKLRAALADTLAASADMFKDVVEGVIREARSTKAQESDVETLKDDLKPLVDQMETIIKERLDELEGIANTRLDGIESAFDRICKRMKTLEDMSSGRAIRHQQIPMTPQSGPRALHPTIREHHFEPATPSPTGSTSSYFDTEFGTPSPPQFSRKFSVEDRVSIVRAINNIPVGMWEGDDFTIIRRCRDEFAHPKWSSIIFTVRSIFLRGGFLDEDGKALGDNELVISEADWDALSGLQDL